MWALLRRAAKACRRLPQCPQLAAANIRPAMPVDGVNPHADTVHQPAGRGIWPFPVGPSAYAPRANSPGG
jgi:hypothetical protein